MLLPVQCELLTKQLMQCLAEKTAIILTKMIANGGFINSSEVHSNFLQKFSCQEKSLFTTILLIQGSFIIIIIQTDVILFYLHEHYSKISVRINFSYLIPIHGLKNLK